MQESTRSALSAPDARVTTDTLFSTDSKIQVWLEIEVALAKSQAELGMIPQEAAEEIARKGRMEFIDREALLKDIEITRAPIVSLVRFLAEACEGTAGEYVHWGATTQNIMQTAEVLLVRKAHVQLLQGLAGCLEALACQSESGANVVMAGRTQRRHALPITFGFKAAIWIDELLRHEERLRTAEPRVFTLVFGGAVGAMHSFGEQGEALSRNLAERLALNCFDVPSRAVNDHLVEYVLLLALLASTCGKIAHELFDLMSEEIGEVHENLGDAVIGSSTMPQKVNPKLSINVIALASQLRSQVNLALEAGHVSHEGDAASSRILYSVMDSACPLAIEMLAELEELLVGLRLVPERMRSNLELTGGMINCENVMMTLARKGLGRQSAHDVVHESALEAARSNRNVGAVLSENPLVRSTVSPDEIKSMLDPASHLGESVKLALKLAGRARAGAEMVRHRISSDE
ncbi:adenylosuccinate lyase family protein [Marinobacter sediminum]|uniref:class-II fumarase/aspartase family protein n=1 Tax=Marinobacter sediminum TaxID=256323 RepID=UPI00202DEB20|nr:adenylosuccinate lyase family protein [Marinobacter sediminum]MCM0613799.1 adenylosuccinate lyase family protein [Marinobacter sediminum]